MNAARRSQGSDERSTRARVIRRARELFLHGERIDMQEMASQEGIGRATLYRWVGGRDNLIAEAIWSFAEPFLIQLADDTTELRGRDRILTIIRKMGEDLLSLEPYMAFLNREPTAALRILTTSSTFIQQRMVEYIAVLLRHESEAGAIDLPEHVPVDTLAYAVLRMAESFFYADIVAGRRADVDEAILVVGLILPASQPVLLIGDTAGM